jgi:hypothetical protein
VRSASSIVMEFVRECITQAHVVTNRIAAHKWLPGVRGGVWAGHSMGVKPDRPVDWARTSLPRGMGIGSWCRFGALAMAPVTRTCGCAAWLACRNGSCSSRILRPGQSGAMPRGSRSKARALPHVSRRSRHTATGRERNLRGSIHQARSLGRSKVSGISGVVRE